MKRAFYTIFYTAFCAVLPSCASGGHHSATSPPSRLVSFDPAHDTMPARFRPSITAVLEKHGFAVTKEAPLLLWASLDRGVVVFNASVSLHDGAQIIASGSAVNIGTGTLVARDAAADAIANRAIEAFDKQLGKTPAK